MCCRKGSTNVRSPAMSLCTSVSSADVRDVVPPEKNRFDCLMQSKLSEAVVTGSDCTLHASLSPRFALAVVRH